MSVQAPKGWSELALTIRLFGSFEAQLNGDSLPRTRTRKSQWLLALFVLRPQQALDRHWLAGQLWPDSLEAEAMANLRRSLTDLRRVLGDVAARLEAPTPGTLRWNAADANIDSREFDLAIARGDSTSLERAVALYRGPLLEGCPEEWVLPERNIREQAFIQAARQFRRAISVDPLRESVQRALMASLAAGGDPAAATQVYRDLRLMLHREMQIAPSPETTAVLEEIRAQSKLNTTIPALPAAHAAPPLDNIPQPVSSLIGRQSEVQEVRLQLDTARLVTLTGAGGVGKTRLAIRIADGLVREYPDGACFVELATLSDSSLLPHALASAIGVREEPGRTMTAVLLHALRLKTLLLVLDNCEHLIEVCAQIVTDILSGCPSVRVLATSREALGVGGEVAWRVPSLSIPVGPSMSHTDKDAMAILMDYDSVRLFVHRASLVQTDFALTHENARAVAEICGSLDGMPLAIELAAARLKAMSAEQIASRLGDRFRLLTGGSRTALPRQQTLRATLDWDYDLLSQAEREALQRLSVFTGGWTLEAAEALLLSRRGGAFETLDLLEHLVDKSLVVYEGRASGSRYHLLETVREYGRERLQESGGRAIACERHRDFFLQMAEDTEPKLMGNEQAAVLARLELEHDNLRAAMDYCHEAGNTEMYLRMAGALWRFWRTLGFHAEGRRRLVVALAAEHAAPVSSVRAKALNSLGVLSAHQGEYARGRELFLESLEIRRALSDERGTAVALENLGQVAMQMGDLSDSRALHAEVVTIHRRRGDRRMLASSLSNSGYTAFSQGDYVAARAFNEESLRLHRDLGNEWGAATALDNLGDLERVEGDLVAAHRRHAEALPIAHGLGDERLTAQILEGLARTSAARGQAERAARLFGFQEALREALGAPLPQMERENQARAIVAVRSALRGEGFDVAWTEGREMTIERGIEYALNQECAC
jgi:non-specific serine/threonine protein kinase